MARTSDVLASTWRLRWPIQGAREGFGMTSLGDAKAALTLSLSNTCLNMVSTWSTILQVVGGQLNKEAAVLRTCRPEASIRTPLNQVV